MGNIVFMKAPLTYFVTLSQQNIVETQLPVAKLLAKLPFKHAVDTEQHKHLDCVSECLTYYSNIMLLFYLKRFKLILMVHWLEMLWVVSISTTLYYGLSALCNLSEQLASQCIMLSGNKSQTGPTVISLMKLDHILLEEYKNIWFPSASTLWFTVSWKQSLTAAYCYCYC